MKNSSPPASQVPSLRFPTKTFLRFALVALALGSLATLADAKKEKKDTNIEPPSPGTVVQLPGDPLPPPPPPAPDPLDPAPVVSNPPIAAPFSEVGAAQLRANWSANGNPVGTIYTAILSLAPSPSTNGAAGNQTVQTLDLSTLFSGLAPNTAYYVDALATAPGGTASAVTSLGSTVTFANPPAALAPTNVQPTAFTVNWGNNSNPPGTSYNAQISLDPAFATLAGNQTNTAASATFSRLTPNTTYYARVAAVNALGVASAFQALASVFTPPTLLQTSALTGSAVSPTAIDWTWTAAANATGYRLVNASGGSISGDLPPQTLHFSETGLVVNTPYTRSVIAINGGAGAVSNPVTRYTLANPAALVQATGVGVSTITLQWATNGNPDYTGFRVNYWELGGSTASVTVNAARVVLSRLLGGTTYFIDVRALNGDGVVSEPASAAGAGGNAPLAVVTAGTRVGFSVTNVKVFPNPFRPSHGDTEIRFGGLPANTHIQIYTIAGEKVKDLTNGTLTSVPWDGRNDHGEPVASGIYYALTDAAGDRKTLKVAIQR